MVVNVHHYRRLTVKQSFDIENTVLDSDNVIDFPIQTHDLSRYDEVLFFAEIISYSALVEQRIWLDEAR